MGSEDAPITLIEYASMTCGHCARHQALVWPKIKSDYVDKGLVRFVFREYPLDPVAMAGAVIARCLPKEQYFDFIDMLFHTQQTWAFVKNPKEGLVEVSRRAGCRAKRSTRASRTPPRSTAFAA